MAVPKPVMPRDNNSDAIQTLSPLEGTVVQLTISAGNSSIALPEDAEVIEVAASDLCRLKFGTASVDATSGARVFPPGVAVYKVPEGATHVAVTQIGTSSGFVTICEMR